MRNMCFLIFVLSVLGDVETDIGDIVALIYWANQNILESEFKIQLTLSMTSLL